MAISREQAHAALQALLERDRKQTALLDELSAAAREAASETLPDGRFALTLTLSADALAGLLSWSVTGDLT